MKIEKFEDLECWKEARKLVNMVYDAIKESKEFHKDIRLKSQCTGAAVSTMGNIPEGFVRRSNKEFVQFLFISISSAAELQSHFYVVMDRNYITKETFIKIYNQAGKVSKIISGLITYLLKNQKRYKPTKKTK